MKRNILLFLLVTSGYVIHSMENQQTSFMQKFIKGTKKVVSLLKPTPAQQQIMTFMLINCLMQQMASATVALPLDFERQWSDYATRQCGTDCASLFKEFLSNNPDECINIGSYPLNDEQNHYIHTGLCSSSLLKENDNIVATLGYPKVPEVNILACVSETPEFADCFWPNEQNYLL